MPILRPYQSKLEHDILEAWQHHRVVLAVLPTGGGKCLGRGTPVMLHSGRIVSVEQVKPGDLLMGPDSAPRRVLSVCSGVDSLYRVTPKKGDAYVVNESHILSLRMTGGSDNSCGIAAGSIVNLGVLDYLGRTKTFRHCAKGWRAAVDFGGVAPVGLEPYVLGLWLGDGTSRHLSFTTGDEEIMAELARFAARHLLFLRYESNSEGSVVIHVVERPGAFGWAGRRGGKANGWLRAHDLIRNKHIPHEYKTADRATRLAVLAGLLDADGALGHGGYDLTLVNERLFDDAMFVARSLGFACYKKKVRKTCMNNGVEGTYFRCFISGDVREIPCKIARKQARGRVQKKDVLTVGLKVEPIGRGEYFGFEIDGDRLFLLGDFTVTHNTVLFCSIMQNHDGISVALAHRSELVAQMSLALARNGLRHRVIAPAAVVAECQALHMAELGRRYVDPHSNVIAAGVHTIVNHPEPWMTRVSLWVCDEGHHLLTANIWGKAVALFTHPQCRGLSVTATPIRADGKGLGRHADGLADVLIEGPGMRPLITAGYLCDYDVFAPKSDLDLSNVSVGPSGEYVGAQLRAAVHQSHLVGDMVKHYQRFTPGALGLTFTVDVDSAEETAEAYRAAGVPAEALSAKTPSVWRARVMRAFRARDILQITNCDLLGEGTDVPACEVVTLGRPTESFGLYRQQFGRGARPDPASGKKRFTVIDPAGNIFRHGLPDAPFAWSLDGRARGSRTPGGLLLTSCTECAGVYERFRVACPYCGHEPVPADRTAPRFVEGDLMMLDPAVLAVMRGEIDRIDGAPFIPGHLQGIAARGAYNTHVARQHAQRRLRHVLALYGGWRTSLGESLREAQRRFYLTYGVDVMTAQALGRPEAEALVERVLLTASPIAGSVDV